MGRLLVVEDDETIGSLLDPGLTAQGPHGGLVRT
jgi:hypothetical protein